MSCQFTKSIPRYVIAGILAVLWIAFLCTQTIVPLFQTVEYLWPRVSGVFVLLIASLLWEITLPDIAGKIISAVFLLWMPFWSVMTLEGLQQGTVGFFSLPYFLNILLCFGVYALLFAAFNRVRVSIMVGSLFFLILAVVNYYMLDLRNAPLQPWDILAAQTAVNVWGGLDFKLSDTLVNFVCLTFGMWAIALQLQYEYTGWKKRILVSGTALGLCVLAFVGAGFGIFSGQSGLVVDAWNAADAFRQNGYAVNFTMNLRTLNNPRPKGYSSVTAASIVARAEKDYHPTAVSPTKPNIIVIMNEAFSDLTVLGDTALSEDPLSFVHGLSENTIKGNLVVPVFGGGTCNTEYEFLTGNTCYMLRDGSYPMQQFVTKNAPSLATTLRDQGYKTVGLHPLYGTSWNRSRAYPLMGFQEFYTIDDFTDPEKLREYTSDREDYRKVISLYENKGTEPLFLFNVTVQNHGGYAWDDANLLEDITFPGSRKYRYARQYYALIRESDRATEELVNYFRQQSEPTVIVFFGDHQPSLEDEYYDSIEGFRKQSQLDQSIAIHTVPFFIWANYDIAERNEGTISVNYLHNMVLKTAGRAMTPYDEYLDTLSQKLPVLSSVVCEDRTGKQYNYQDESMPYASIMAEYNMVQYNQVFDKAGRDSNLFYLTTQG